MEFPYTRMRVAMWDSDRYRENKSLLRMLCWPRCANEVALFCSSCRFWILRLRTNEGESTLKSRNKSVPPVPGEQSGKPPSPAHSSVPPNVGKCNNNGSSTPHIEVTDEKIGGPSLCLPNPGNNIDIQSGTSAIQQPTSSTDAQVHYISGFNVKPTS